VVWIGAIVVAPAVSSTTEEGPTWQYGLSFSYLTGDYGGDEDTDILYTAAAIKRYFEQGDVTLTIPYLDISDDNVTFIDGGAEVIAGTGGGSGLGDLILKGRYYAVEQDGWLPFIDLVGSLKIPTADEDKGLGTGEADFTVMAEGARRLENEAWIVLGELGYTFVGEPSGLDADNRWLYSIGLAYELDPKVTVSGYLDGRTAIFDGNDDPLSALFIGEYKFRTDLRLDSMLEVGLNDGAPDLGITFGLRKRM
jgi:hypothetical protein